MQTKNDVYFMHLALVEAQRGMYKTAPNPNVGCVIVKNNQVIASGFHHYCGGAHAEIDALSKLDTNDVVGADIYVTLEPCSHFGKTPPCVDAIINAKPKRVIIACTDPFSLVSGRGIAKLKNAGIEVTLDVCESVAIEVNRGFMKRICHGKPWVTLKIASSLDGKTALNNGQSKWITGNDARQDAHYLRASSCALITGSGTVLCDNPSMTVRDINLVKNPWRIVVDNQLKTTPDFKIYPANIADSNNLRRIIATTCVDSAKINKFTNIGVDLWNDITNQETGKVDLEHLLNRLGQLECNYVMLEAGANLSGAFLVANLVDEIVIYMAPCLMGNIAQNMFILPELNNLADKQSWRFHSVTQLGNDIKLILRR